MVLFTVAFGLTIGAVIIGVAFAVEAAAKEIRKDSKLFVEAPRPLVVIPLPPECKHDWLIHRATAINPYPINNPGSHIIPTNGGFDVTNYLGIDTRNYSWGYVVDGYYQDAVCRKCDKTDLSFTKLLPGLKAKMDRDKALLESLKKTISEVSG